MSVSSDRAAAFASRRIAGMSRAPGSIASCRGRPGEGTAGGGRPVTAAPCPRQSAKRRLRQRARCRRGRSRRARLRGRLEARSERTREFGGGAAASCQRRARPPPPDCTSPPDVLTVCQTLTACQTGVAVAGARASSQREPPLPAAGSPSASARRAGRRGIGANSRSASAKVDRGDSMPRATATGRQPRRTASRPGFQRLESLVTELLETPPAPEASLLPSPPQSLPTLIFLKPFAAHCDTFDIHVAGETCSIC